MHEVGLEEGQLFDVRQLPLAVCRHSLSNMIKYLMKLFIKSILVLLIMDLLSPLITGMSSLFFKGF